MTRKCFACGELYKEEHCRTCKCSIPEVIAAERKACDEAKVVNDRAVEYREREWPAHTCCSCSYSFTTNAGAVYPGLACNKKKKAYEELGLGGGNSQVRKDAICKLHPALNRQMVSDVEPHVGETVEGDK